MIAESEETAVIYGMPQQAIHSGAVDLVLPLHDIPTAIQSGVARDNVHSRKSRGSGCVRTDRNPTEIAGLSPADAGRRAVTRIFGTAAPEVQSNSLVGKLVSWVPMETGDSVDTLDGTTVASSDGTLGRGPCLPRLNGETMS